MSQEAEEFVLTIRPCRNTRSLRIACWLYEPTTSPKSDYFLEVNVDPRCPRLPDEIQEAIGEVCWNFAAQLGYKLSRSPLQPEELTVWEGGKGEH